ncbi:MAG: DUF418 domain-containing protein [Cytophagales bacterium]
MQTNNSLNERNLLLDSLRGYALTGLFLVHMVELFELYWYQYKADPLTENVFLLFGGKVYAILAMLFGVSFYLIEKNFKAKKSNSEFYNYFFKRSIVLWIIGFFHGLYYGGEILQLLAIAGIFILVVHQLNFKTLLVLSVLLLLQIPYWVFFTLKVVPHVELYTQPAHWALYVPVQEAYAHGSFWDVIQTNFWKTQLSKWAFMLESGRFSIILGISLLGYLLGKMEFFDFKKINIQRYLLITLCAVIVLYNFVTFKDHFAVLYNFKKYWMLDSIYGSYKDLSTIILSVGIFCTIYKIEFLQKILNYLAPLGKMSLSLYVLQSLICMPIFYGFGLNGYTFIRSWDALFLGVFFWVLQLIFVNFWLKNHEYGPLEWLWRKLSSN